MNRSKLTFRGKTWTVNHFQLSWWGAVTPFRSPLLCKDMDCHKHWYGSNDQIDNRSILFKTMILNWGKRGLTCPSIINEVHVCGSVSKYSYRYHLYSNGKVEMQVRHSDDPRLNGEIHITDQYPPELLNAVLITGWCIGPNN